jgi:hypothetical protein
MVESSICGLWSSLYALFALFTQPRRRGILRSSASLADSRVYLTQRFQHSKMESLQRRILWRCDKGKPAVRRGRKATGLIMRLPGYRTEGGCAWILVTMTSVLGQG